MTGALASAVELLDRSLSYTRVALAAVAGLSGDTPTPCLGWPLSRLLAHMDDGLDAYAESAGGRVALVPASGEARLDAVQAKACALLGRWLDDPPSEVRLGDRRLPAEVLVGSAALEITVHGWDLYRAAGRPAAIPADLAGPLLEVARGVVPGDPLPCFAPAVTSAPSAPDSRQLLGLAGRT